MEKKGQSKPPKIEGNRIPQFIRRKVNPVSQPGSMVGKGAQDFNEHSKVIFDEKQFIFIVLINNFIQSMLLFEDLEQKWEEAMVEQHHRFLFLLKNIYKNKKMKTIFLQESIQILLQESAE